MISLKSLLSSHSTTEPTASIRNAETVSAELDANRQTADALASKIATAQADVENASRAYDDAMKAYAVGSAKAPDRKALDNAVATLDGLRRVADVTARAIASLESELRAVQQSEAITNESDALEALITESEAALCAFLRDAAQAKESEARLFALLFHNRTGLKRKYGTNQSTARARQARYEIREEAIATAKHLHYKLHSSFQTDGERNLHDPEEQWSAFVADTKRDAQRGRVYADAEASNPRREIGELVPELEGR